MGDGAPRNYFLNEHHELTPTDKDGFGPTKKYTDVNWRSKGQALHSSLVRSRDQILASPDPLKESRYFLAVLPEKVLHQPSQAKKAMDGKLARVPDFRGDDAGVFRRLGLDLLGVASTGEAIVHATIERFDRLAATSERLESEGVREQALWAPLAKVSTVPLSLRVDESWLNRETAKNIHAVFEFQPVLRGSEVDRVVKAIREELGKAGSFEFDAAGTDFSGRRWYRALAQSALVKKAAVLFQSVQRIHAPHLTPLAASTRRTARVPSVPPAAAPAPADLPVVAIVDAGIPAQHPILSTYLRMRYSIPDGVTEALGSHGSAVASRVVFEGLHEGDQPTLPRCRFVDINVASVTSFNPEDPHIDDQQLVNAMDNVANAAPDVRVFNLSIGSRRPLAAGAEHEVDRAERLEKLRSLDNFAFQRDVVVVVAAGNSPPGVQPNPPYPGHLADPQWQLGHWASGFNTLTVGAYVQQPHAEGVARRRWAPSPFTLIGPGAIARAPIPDFAAPGGDGAVDYQRHSGMGEWCLGADGQIEDHSGTSVAAPVVAQGAARLALFLSAACQPGTRPTAALVRAALTLLAERKEVPGAPAIEKLAKRTLGRGLPRISRALAPASAAALLFWQGVLPDAKHVVRVRVPVPGGWVDESKEPTLRLVVAWLSPVNEAYEGWACRHVEARLRSHSGGDALGGASKLASGHYPVIERSFDLKEVGEWPVPGELLLELSYQQLHEEPVGRPYSQETRVGVAIELRDGGSEGGVSPHAALQAHVLIDGVAVQLSVGGFRTAIPVG